MISTYLPRNSLLHRAPPSIKLILLIFLSAVLFLYPVGWFIGSTFILVLLSYIWAQIPWISLWEMIRTVLWLVLMIAALNVWLHGYQMAVVSGIRLLTLILAAHLVSVTTRMSDMIDTLNTLFYPLRWLGLNPAKISLGFSLALRFIPILMAITHEVKEAQKVRGLENHLLAIAVPVIIRALKTADLMSDAMDARACESMDISTSNGPSSKHHS